MDSGSDGGAILVAGYPKSGSTMITVILHGYDIYGLGKETAVKLLENVPVGFPLALKTHNLPRNDLMPPHPDIITTSKVLHIRRNPLDTLLSYLNHIRFDICTNNNKGKYSEYCSRILRTNIYEMEDSEITEMMTLEKLREKNVLEAALENFSSNSLRLPLEPIEFGSWTSHYLKWHQARIEKIELRYEDVVNNFEREVVKMSEFLDLPVSLLKSRAESQSNDAINNRSTFYNKMSAGYFKEFFTKKLTDSFISRHGAEISSLGYTDIYNL